MSSTDLELDERSPRNFDEQFTVGPRELSWLLGVHYNHISKLVAAGMPRAGRGRYNLKACFAWYMQERSTGVDVDELPELVDARRRLITAQAVRNELSNEREQSQLIDADQVADAMLSLLGDLVATINGFPMRLSHELLDCSSSSEVVTRMRPHCHGSLEQLSSRFTALAEDMGLAREGREAAAATVRGAVGRRGAPRAAGEPEAGPVADLFHAVRDPDS